MSESQGKKKESLDKGAGTITRVYPESRERKIWGRSETREELGLGARSIILSIFLESKPSEPIAQKPASGSNNILQCKVGTLRIDNLWLHKTVVCSSPVAAFF